MKNLALVLALFLITVVVFGLFIPVNGISTIIYSIILSINSYLIIKFESKNQGIISATVKIFTITAIIVMVTAFIILETGLVDLSRYQSSLLETIIGITFLIMLIMFFLRMIYTIYKIYKP